MSVAWYLPFIALFHVLTCCDSVSNSSTEVRVDILLFTYEAKLSGSLTLKTLTIILIMFNLILFIFYCIIQTPELTLVYYLVEQYCFPAMF